MATKLSQDARQKRVVRMARWLLSPIAEVEAGTRSDAMVTVPLEVLQNIEHLAAGLSMNAYLLKRNHKGAQAPCDEIEDKANALSQAMNTLMVECSNVDVPADSE